MNKIPSAAPTRPFSRRASALVLWCASLLGAGACQEPDPSPSAGSNSNWLMHCSSDAACGSQTSCRCEACTRDCATDADCAGLADARCVLDGHPALLAQCGTQSREVGICLPGCSPGSCGEGRACASGRCVLVDLPPGPFCDPVAAGTAAARVEEDELLQVFQDFRVAGGVSCGGGQPSAPGAPLRLDARLVCAARVLAADINETRKRSLIDSQGRNTPDRISAAGYDWSGWGESFAMDPNSADDALRLMIEGDTNSCVAMTDSGVHDVGVGSVGTVRVITLGVE